MRLLESLAKPPLWNSAASTLIIVKSLNWRGKMLHGTCRVVLTSYGRVARNSRVIFADAFRMEIETSIISSNWIFNVTNMGNKYDFLARYCRFLSEIIPACLQRRVRELTETLTQFQSQHTNTKNENLMSRSAIVIAEWQEQVYTGSFIILIVWLLTTYSAACIFNPLSDILGEVSC